MPSAEIITIGTEILLGEILDTNARSIAQKLKGIGVDLYRKTTVGDNAMRIAQAIQEALNRTDIVITTGGLGPTVDDPTREAVALAVGVEVEFRAELWDQIQQRFQRFNRPPTANNRRQAFIPKGAIPVENLVGTAPAFIYEVGDKAILALPGVPQEMEYLMQHKFIPYMQARYSLSSIIKTRTLHTAGAGESQIDDRIGDLETLSNPTVGLAAHSGQVDIRIAAKSTSELEADAIIAKVENELRMRLGGWVYGADEETLEGAAMSALRSKGWTLAVIEAGLGGELVHRLAASSQQGYRGGETLPEPPPPEALADLTLDFSRTHQAEVGLGVAIYPGSEKQDVFIILLTPTGKHTFHRPYGGPVEYAPRWAVHHSLDMIRNL